MIETDHSVVVFPIASWPGNDPTMIAGTMIDSGDRQKAVRALNNLVRSHEDYLLRRGVPTAAVQAAMIRFLKDVRDCGEQIRREDGA